MTFDTVRTERLILRRWRDSDRAPYAALNAHPEVMRYFRGTMDGVQSDAMINRLEELFDQQGYGLWAVEVTGSGEFVGFTGLHPMPGDVPGAGGVEIGWRLARHAWGQGYATEAATAALDVAFNGIGLAEIFSVTAVLNERSQRVMRRLGLTEHARYDNSRYPEGHPLRPAVVYRGTPANGQSLTK